MGARSVEETFRDSKYPEFPASDWNMLSRRLAIQPHELSVIENRFRRMVGMGPVVCIFGTPSQTAMSNKE
jgi:hypothetical protein